MSIKSRLSALAAVLVCSASLAQPQPTASLHLVFVLDGLRPDSITEAETPHLYRLRKEGVWFEIPMLCFRR